MAKEKPKFVIFAKKKGKDGGKAVKVGALFRSDYGYNISWGKANPQYNQADIRDLDVDQYFFNVYAVDEDRDSGSKDDEDL